MGSDLKDNTSYSPSQKHQAGQKDGNRESRMEDSPGIPARLVETNDEGEQIETQWQNPEERYDGDILADQVRRGQKHDRGARSQAQPNQMICQCWPGLRELSFSASVGQPGAVR